MAQYYPAGRTIEFPEIVRHLHRSEFERALERADELRLRRLDQRSRPALGRLGAAGGSRRLAAVIPQPITGLSRPGC
jgi:hypothetical protein